MVAGPGDGALGIINDHFCRHSVEPFEGTPVTAQPGGDLLVAHQLQILMPAPSQGHDEQPGGKHLPGIDIGELGAGPEIHLRRLARRELDHRGDLRVGRFQGGKIAAYRGVAALEGVLAHQRLVDRGPVNALLPPVAHLRLVGQHQRGGWGRA